MVLHGVCFSLGIGNVFEVVLLTRLAVYGQTQNTILSQVHIGLFVGFLPLLDMRVEYGLEVFLLKNVQVIGLVGL